MFYTLALGSYTMGTTTVTAYGRVGACTLALVTQHWTTWEHCDTSLRVKVLEYPVKLCKYPPCQAPNAPIPDICEGWQNRDLVRSEYCTDTHRKNAAKDRERENARKNAFA